MTPEEWERCADPDTMLHALSGQADDRRCRLFTCACCRRVWPLLADERSRAAVETAERYADGLADRDELARAEEAAQAVAFAEASARARAGVNVPHVTQATLAAMGERADATIWAAWATAEAARAPAEERRHQCALLRCIFGNPFRPPAPLALAVRAYIQQRRPPPGRGHLRRPALRGPARPRRPARRGRPHRRRAARPPARAGAAWVRMPCAGRRPGEEVSGRSGAGTPAKIRCRLPRPAAAYREVLR